MKKDRNKHMRNILGIFFLIATGVLLAACGSGEMVPPPDPTRSPDTSVESPGTDPTEDGSVSTRPYDPQPGDSALQRGNVYLDEASVLLMESFPPQVGVQLVGNLPTPCHSLRVAISEPDAENNIRLDVYSVVPTDVVCAEVLKPFDANLNLGSYPGGEYTILVNDNKIGEVILP